MCVATGGIMRTAKRCGATIFLTCGAVLLLAVCAGPSWAQEGDLTSSAGVFVKPAHAAARAPQGERSSALRNFNTRKSRPRPAPTPKSSGVKTTPTAESLNAKAIAVIDAKRYADAVEPLRQAVRLKPDYADAQYNLGFALFSLGQFADAVSPLQRASQLDAKDADAFYYLGASLAKLDRHAEAAAAYQQASRLEPK